jgi:hypothetical protein
LCRGEELLGCELLSLLRLLMRTWDKYPRSAPYLPIVESAMEW